jgi:uncharacterized protein (DUF934 family)
MPLIKDGKYADDPFVAVADGAPLPDGPAVVSLKRFLADRQTLLARNAPFGVRLRPRSLRKYSARTHGGCR